MRMSVEKVFTVIPTYGRPDALESAVRSVVLQSHTAWDLLVIGDACDDATRRVMEPFCVDPRIRYANLPMRCGEQALLNSAGMSLSTSSRIAFLNHDDVWLPDHLQVALRTLELEDADFFMGRSLWAAAAFAKAGDAPQFDIVSPHPRSLADVFWHGFEYIEPVSTWVINRDLARRVGPWRRAVDLFRVPIHEWVLRAWRAGARLSGHERVTCLKFQTHWSREAPARNYDTPATAQAWCLDRLTDNAGRAAMAQLAADSAAALGDHMPARFRQVIPYANAALHAAAAALTSAAADRYLETGNDEVEELCARFGIERGQRWRASLQRRTGETGVEPPEFEQVRDWVAAALKLTP